MVECHRCGALVEWMLAPLSFSTRLRRRTGYRVAFAPFSLNKSGDKTLFSLSDPDLTKEFVDPNQTGESVSLMFAAVASARFPGILPPFAISLKSSDSDVKRSGNRWNFVDGGYADNSGAETALDLYSALVDELKNRKDVDLKLILLTSDNPSPAFSNITGTAYGDTVAPIEAILECAIWFGESSGHSDMRLFQAEDGE